MRHSAVSVAALVVVYCFGQPVVREAAAITLLHEFAGGDNDGRDPRAGLILSGSTLFGTTIYGGDPCPNISGGCGTVFSMNTDGSGFTLLHEFVGGVNDGQSPAAGLTLGGSTLYGTTTAGGNYNAGTIFAINTAASSFRLLHEFDGGDGQDVEAGLTLSGSTLYGTTHLGGNGGEGTVFSIKTDGSGFTLLHSFNDGRRPIGGLTINGSTLFGTTSWGGDNGGGTIFSINTNGSGYTPLHEFAGGANDGDGPFTGLIVSGSTLYGTTQGGGDNNRGTIFSMNTNGSGFTLLHEFAGGADDGDAPEAELTLNGSTLYGTTAKGGESDLGTLFSINTDGSGFTLVHEFAGGADDGVQHRNVPDGGGLTLSGSTLYGVTEGGGDFNLGTVFSIEIPEVDLEGDYNDDNSVNAADYVVWRKNTSQSYEIWRTLFGQSGLSTPVDFNNDGIVDAADYVVWRKTDINGPTGYDTWQTHFGQPAGFGSVASVNTNVPEPTTLVMLIVATVGIRLRRRHIASECRKLNSA